MAVEIQLEAEELEESILAILYTVDWMTIDWVNSKGQGPLLIVPEFDADEVRRILDEGHLS